MQTTLTKEQFIGTSVVCGIMVDVVRITVYGLSAYLQQFSSLHSDMVSLVSAASLSAFFGAYIGTKTMNLVTLQQLRSFIGIMLILLGFAIVAGFSEI